MRTRVEWRGGVDGVLVADDRLLRTVDEMVEYVDVNASILDDAQLRWLGGVVFFTALRDFGRTAEPILPTVVKALDSFYPVLADERAHQVFTSGVITLRDRLFPHRGDPYESLLPRAFEVVKG